MIEPAAPSGKPIAHMIEPIAHMIEPAKHLIDSCSHFDILLLLVENNQLLELPDHPCYTTHCRAIVLPAF
jgi:hypothetical protein